MLKKTAFAFLFFLLTFFFAFAQDGVDFLEIRDINQKDTSGLWSVYSLPFPADYDGMLASVEVSEFFYRSDGLRVKGYMAQPRKPGKYPCIIYNRGGIGAFSSFNVPLAQRVLGEMASWGYVVITTQLRGNDGSEGREDFGGEDLADVLNLIPLMGKVPKADTSRIGMYGRSSGGMKTYLALARTDRIKAAVVIGASADLKHIQEVRPALDSLYATVIPGYRQHRERLLEERSMVCWPEKLNKKTPILLMHGAADWRVPAEESFVAAQALYKSGHPFRFVFFENDDHAISANRDEVNRLTRMWFGRMGN